jgi:hypothetical protein
LGRLTFGGRYLGYFGYFVAQNATRRLPLGKKQMETLNEVSGFGNDTSDTW